MLGASGNSYGLWHTFEHTKGSSKSGKEEAKLNITKHESIEMDSIKPKNSQENSAATEKAVSSKNSGFFQSAPVGEGSSLHGFLSTVTLKF